MSRRPPPPPLLALRGRRRRRGRRRAAVVHSRGQSSAEDDKATRRRIPGGSAGGEGAGRGCGVGGGRGGGGGLAAHLLGCNPAGALRRGGGGGGCGGSSCSRLKGAGTLCPPAGRAGVWQTLGGPQRRQTHWQRLRLVMLLLRRRRRGALPPAAATGRGWGTRLGGGQSTTYDDGCSGDRGRGQLRRRRAARAASLRAFSKA